MSAAPSFFVFDPSTFLPLGELVISEAICEEKDKAFGSCVFWAKPSNENIALASANNIIVVNGMFAARIEGLSFTNESGHDKLAVYGYTLPFMLRDRIVNGTYEAANKSPTLLMCGLVDSEFISPADADRVYPGLMLDPEQISFGDAIASYQRTGNEVYEHVNALAVGYELGIRVIFDLENSRYVFRVVKGVDRSISQAERSPVVFSDELENLNSTYYVKNAANYKNVGIVFGEGDGAARVRTSVGNSVGMNRREVFVDARDLTSAGLLEADYLAALQQRGMEYVNANPNIESIEGIVSNAGVFVYGRDFFLGDKVTIISRRLNMSVDAIVEGVTHTYDSRGYNLSLTFGYEQPRTIMTRRG